MSPHTLTAESRRDAHWMGRARAHDPILHLHSILVSELCACFSAFLSLHIDEQRRLRRAGLLHDIGKLAVPSSILRKPSGLTPEERGLVERHAHLGFEMLLKSGEIDDLLLSSTRDHHERLDGSGYPQKLTAPQISIFVRIVTLCDVFAALTEPRPYADAMKWNEALETMAKKRTRLDLELLAAFATMIAAAHGPRKRPCKFQRNAMSIRLQ